MAMVLSMTAARSYRRALVVGGLLSYVAVFFAFLLWEEPGLGIGHFYYLSIALLALASNGRIGALAGIAAAALYTLNVLLNPSVPSADILTLSTPIRLVTYTSVGVLLGWFAGHDRDLVERLRILADRDSLTGLPNTRAFEAAINRRLADARPFALLIGDMDGLRAVNEARGHPEGDLLLHRFADALGAVLAPEDQVARVGGDEFAVLMPIRPGDDARDRATRLEATLGATAGITFGWASFPADGDNALSLYRAADERLYARKLIRDRDTANVAALPVREAAARRSSA